MSEGQKILIVDDSETVRHVLKVYLMNRQYRFVEADGGERALRLLRLTPISLVIADIKMPRMTGLEFVTHVRQSEDARVRKTPVILITGDKAKEELTKRALAIGANACLEKPLNLTALLRTIDTLLPPVPP